jgi:beta-glucosidase-like glycosyl hydrolase/CubicO group peptidase (beta-lactamase class C family)
MSLAEKAGQMIGGRGSGLPRHPRSKEQRELLDQIRGLGLGSMVVFESELGSLPREIAAMQGAAKVPLLIAADMERGLAFRVRRGVVPLPYAMAIGATRSEEFARFSGEVTAREGRAVGIHWALAPVADVNNNPANPIINIRSYGEDPALVARMTAAFVAGVRAGGLLSTAKHFPGHGDTAVDSHLQLATITADRSRLEAVELKPFRSAVLAGVDVVMLGHIAVPAVDASGAPATLSAPLAEDLLRGDLGFGGLIVTDALDMAGARAAWDGQAVVRAVAAGADIVLLPRDPRVAVQAIVRAVKEGQLAESRIDASVLRILETKDRLGLPARRAGREGPAPLADVGRPEDVERAFEIARRSITVVRNEGALPLRAEEPLRILHVVLSSEQRFDAIQGFPEDELARRRIPTVTVPFGPDVSEESIGAVLARAREATHVIASCFARVGSYRGTADMPEPHVKLLRALAASGRPLVMVSFGSPYLLRQVPEAQAFVCAYGWAESSQRAAIGALFGEYPVTGKLPVTLPGICAYGQGLEMPRREMTLRRVAPEQAGFRAEGLAELDRVMQRAVVEKAFPGGVVAVGKDSSLGYLKPYGRLAYDADAPPVREDTIYDLASLTKVIGTTTMAMILVDEGKLDLSKPVSAFLPRFRGGAKDTVTVEQLLTHSAGLDWWAPLYKEVKGKEAYLERIEAMDLKYEPGTRSVYSDLGVILLGEVLERVAGQPLEAFVRRHVLDPLGMNETRYRPGPELLARIAPTENDPWRGRVVRGEVHDENAYALGGVAPHAGLFGTAPDLARFAQMMLNGGVYDHQRIVSRETVERFTRRAGVPDSSRALGWDTPSANSSAGELLSRGSFGHTGFTGTSMWMDPDRKLFVVLLTNRVHPTRENNAIREVRRAVADAVVRALEAP